MKVKKKYLRNDDILLRYYYIDSQSSSNENVLWNDLKENSFDPITSFTNKIVCIKNHKLLFYNDYICTHLDHSSVIWSISTK